MGEMYQMHLMREYTDENNLKSAECGKIQKIYQNLRGNQKKKGGKKHVTKMYINNPKFTKI